MSGEILTCLGHTDWHYFEPCICTTSPSLAMVGEPVKRHNVRAYNGQDVFDWLNPLSLGTMSASAYIENVA